MSMIHRSRDCWCGEQHDLSEAVLRTFDHMETVRQAEVLGPLDFVPGEDGAAE